MSKLDLSLIVILFCSHFAQSLRYENGALYVPLIKWIRNHYTSSAVFLLAPDEQDKQFDGLKVTQMLYIWSRLLGQELVATVAGTFKNILTIANHNNNLRPLIIVFLPGPRAFLEFSNCTRSLKMSSFAWFVIFVPTIMNLESNYCHEPMGNPFHLLFDTEMLVMCYEDTVLREWYSVDGENMEVFDLVEWKPEKQILGSPNPAIDVLTNLSLYERRNDLQGKVLRAVTVKNSLLVRVKDKKLEGYFSKVISELETALNFTLDVIAEESEYGIFNETTKRWSGAFDFVATGKVDIGVSDFSMTNIRLDYVDYTVPIITTRNCLCMKQPEIFAVKWFAYYKTFSFALWMSFLMVILIGQFILSFIRSRVESCKMSELICDEIFRIWGIICQQGVAEFPRNSSLKLAYFSMLVTALVVSSAYSASLICFVTARVRDLPLYTIDGFLRDRGYSVIVIRGSADYDMYANSRDPLSSTIKRSMKPYYSLPLDVRSGFKKICEDNKLVFYTGYSTNIQNRATDFHIPCETTCFDIGRVDSLSLILSKKNQYTLVINYYLQKLLNTGLLNRFKNEIKFVEETRFQPVAFSSVASVLIIFSCGTGLAFMVLFAEMYCDRHKGLNVDVDRSYD